MAPRTAKTLLEMESELLDLEIMVADNAWRKRRRESWRGCPVRC